MLFTSSIFPPFSSRSRDRIATPCFSLTRPIQQQRFGAVSKEWKTLGVFHIWWFSNEDGGGARCPHLSSLGMIVVWGEYFAVCHKRRAAFITSGERECVIAWLRSLAGEWNKSFVNDFNYGMMFKTIITRLSFVSVTSDFKLHYTVWTVWWFSVKVNPVRIYSRAVWIHWYAGGLDFVCDGYSHQF